MNNIPQRNRSRFCIANQKGGVGKRRPPSTWRPALPHKATRAAGGPGSARQRHDGQRHRQELAGFNLYQVLIGEATIAQARVRSESGGYDVLPANRELSGAEIDLVQMDERERQLKAAIDSVKHEYDFVLIDCPPTLSLLTLNGHSRGAASSFPCSEYFALEGLSDLVNTIKRVHRNINDDLRVIGLLRVMFDPRMTLQQQVSAQLESHFGDKVFKTVVPRNVRLAEAPSYGMPGVVYDRGSRGAQAYISFGAEMIERVKELN